ncbi:MAG: hypothetical protein U1F20_03490 [Lysobacterales bacterium]
MALRAHLEFHRLVVLLQRRHRQPEHDDGEIDMGARRGQRRDPAARLAPRSRSAGARAGQAPRLVRGGDGIVREHVEILVYVPCERPVPRLSYTNAPTPAAGSNRCIQSQSSAESISEPCTSTTMGTSPSPGGRTNRPARRVPPRPAKIDSRTDSAMRCAGLPSNSRRSQPWNATRCPSGFPVQPRVLVHASSCPRASSPLAPSMRRQRSVSAREGAMSSGVPSASSAYAPTRQSAASAGRIIAHSASIRLTSRPRATIAARFDIHSGIQIIIPAPSATARIRRLPARDTSQADQVAGNRGTAA